VSGPVAAWRAEIVAYQGDPAPRMYHLGEAFSLDLDALRGAVRARAAEIADCLAGGEGDERRVAERFRSWADALADRGPGDRLERGEALVETFAGGGCVWELSLRPVRAGTQGGD
jgi:hypothetical protein